MIHSAFTLNILFALTIFLMAYIAGYWTIYRSVNISLVCIEALAAGIFLGAAFFHMLPDAIRQFKLIANSHIPWAIMICLLSTTLMYLSSKMLTSRTQKLTPQLLSGLLVAGMLGVHSLVEGMALGLAQQLRVILIVFIAIMFHKAAASFALAAHLQHSQYTKSKNHQLIFIFSLLTPLGILIGSTSQRMVSIQTSQWLDAVFLAIAAGTFLYLALFEYLIPWFSQSSSNITRRLYFCLSGLVLMGSLAWWV